MAMYFQPRRMARQARTVRSWARWAALLLLAANLGCVSVPPPARDAGSIRPPGAAVPPGPSARPAPPAPGPAASAGIHILQPGDEIDVQVFREPDLSGVFILSPAGDIRHSLLGSVMLGGLSMADAETRLTQRLGEKYLVNPRVMIKLLNAQSAQVVVLGEVKNPGVYPLPMGQTISLLQAIARAGGFTELASPDRVRIVRKTQGAESTIKVRVSDLLDGKGAQKDIILEPNDVVMVPQVVF